MNLIVNSNIHRFLIKLFLYIIVISIFVTIFLLFLISLLILYLCLYYFIVWFVCLKFFVTSDILYRYNELFIIKLPWWFYRHRHQIFHGEDKTPGFCSLFPKILQKNSIDHISNHVYI